MTTAPQRSANSQPTTTKHAASGALRQLLTPEAKIPYPDTPEWQHLGATVRQEAARRQQHRRRQRHGWLLLALGAAAAACLLLLPSNVSVIPPPAGTGIRQQATVTPAPLSDTEATEAIRMLAARFELDTLAVELVQAGVADPRRPGDLSRILSSLELQDDEPSMVRQ